MKTRPIQAAQIGGAQPQADALDRARRVFLRGNGLPGRWAGLGDFTVLETGFGLGHNFLALWDAWRQDPQRCERLHVVSLEEHPTSAEDLARVHAGSALPDLARQLLDAWPPLTPNLHHLGFEGGRLRLTLAWGDAEQLLPALRLQAQAVFLDGASPKGTDTPWSPALLKAVGRLSAPDATAAADSVAQTLREGLATAGFTAGAEPGLGHHSGPDITCARFVPRASARSLPTLAVPGADAVVVGAGLAGASAARALAERGLRVTVLEQAGDVATGASGNPAGLFHGTVSADDGPYARLYRTAALLAEQRYREAIAAGVPGSVEGLLRLAPHQPGGRTPQALLQANGLTPCYVQWLDAQAASALAGLRLDAPCWFYPGGGWIAPAAWVRHALAHPLITVRTRCAVSALLRRPGQWECQDGHGGVQARSARLVLAHAAGTDALLRPLGHTGWPLRSSRGQVSFWPQDNGLRPHRPLAGDGYVIATPGGLLCGATRQADDPDPDPRAEDHRYNLERLQRLTGISGPPAGTALQGRVGWRLAAEDRLPVAGAVPTLGLAHRATQARLLPREAGLFVLTALGARGLTLGPLMGELVAAQATGTPWPVEQDLADAVDPGRWQVRQARQAS